MGKFCEACNKGAMSGNNVSHSNRKTKRAFAPNIQKVSVTVEGGATKRLQMCTRCYRTVKSMAV